MKLFRLLLLLLCLCPIVAYAQTAEVNGIVQDPSGAVLPKASIEFRNQDTGVRRQTVAASDGNYHIASMDPGKYDATVQAKGFKTLTREGVVLHVGDKATINFTIQVGSESQSVKVDGSGPTINTTDASVSTVVDQKFVENMPLNGRSLQSLISLAPGVVQTPIPYGSSAGNSGEFSVNGQRTESNYYTVDGVSANVGSSSGTYGAGAAGLIPSQTALGTTQNMTSIDALQEFRITTSTYSAEYGRTPGGQISLQTRSGTEQVHGSIFDYLRNDALDSNNWFNNHATPIIRKTAERQNDFGGTLGGPIYVPHVYDGKHRTFFFSSYEGLRLTVPTAAVTTQVPTAALRNSTATALQPFINAFPIANGTDASGATGLAYFTAAYSLPSKLDTYSIRIDHSVGSRTHLFGRYSDSTSSSESRGTDNLAGLTHSRFATRSTTDGMTYVFSQKMVNDARFNYTWTQNSSATSVDSFGGAQPATLNTFLPGASSPNSQVAFFLYFGNYPAVRASGLSYNQTQLNITDTQQIQLARHSLKAGFDFRRLDLTQDANRLVVSPTYTAAQLQSNISGSVSVYSFGNPAEPIYNNYSAYIQDEWKISRQTTISAGLRWDLNPPPTNGNGRIPPVLSQITDLATATILPYGTPLWNTSYSGFAPRFGVASQLNSRPGRETVIRAGLGNFFDTGNTLSSVGFAYLGFRSTANTSGLSFPFASPIYNIPAASTNAPYNSTAVGFDRNLPLPYTLQWNSSLEQALGASRSFTIGYVASAGRRLLVGAYSNPAALNPAFSAGNAAILISGGSWSNYNSLQTQFQQRVSRGLQVQAAMTWSHSIDNRSNGFVAYQPLLKGDSDFDVRENFQLAATYEIPHHNMKRFVSALANRWAVDIRAFYRSSAPVDVYGNPYVASDGTYVYARPNLVPGQPLYTYGSRTLIPGGRKLNYSAFQSVTGAMGNAPRNFVRGFGANEIDFALRREFPLGERARLQFRAEAFNLLNHPNFGAVYNTLSSGPTLFGQAQNTLNVSLKNQSSLYQQGGPRSGQLALKILF